MLNAKSEELWLQPIHAVIYQTSTECAYTDSGAPSQTGPYSLLLRLLAHAGVQYIKGCPKPIRMECEWTDQPLNNKSALVPNYLGP